MQITKHRTSFALDEDTADRLQRLARRWRVSKAEVVRRAVKIAEDHADEQAHSVAERLDAYRAARRIDAAEADRYLDQVSHDRADWARRHDSA
ncbi:MAG TPA: ribbon-helix-helix protein, CopG family [Spirochaetia bacterium]|nr:ribbon-helix-helix protein, CopG family [Spirochaetia bacterium]